MNSILIFDRAGEGLPILCLHGHPGSRQCMQVFTQALNLHWSTIAPDFRGYGASKTAQPFVMEQHLEDVIQLLDHLQVSKVVVLGWSLGGIIGLELALNYPDRIEGLILVASAAHPLSDHPPIRLADYFFTVISSLFNRLSCRLTWNRNWFGRRSLYRFLVQSHTEETYRYLARDAWPAFFKTTKFANRALSQALRQGYNRLDELEKLTCPTLVLAGECDRHITSHSSYLTYQHLKKSEWICYPKTAHLFPWEIPEQVNADIQDWLIRTFS